LPLHWTPLGSHRFFTGLFVGILPIRKNTYTFAVEIEKELKVERPLRSKSKAVKHYLFTRESLGLGTHEALHQAEHKQSQNYAREKL
jgi:hypothetical protein